MSAYGTSTLTNCVSNVNITSSIVTSACNAAGLICTVRPGANVTIDDCVVKGNITATMKRGKEEMAGFVRGQEGTCTLNNCLYLGSGNGDTFSRTFVGDAHYGATTTLNNCYYLNACGTAQGTQITAEQLKSGEVTKKLQNNRTDKCYWAQQLGEMPDFYNTADKSKANYVYYDAAKKGWTCDDFRLTDGQPLPIGLDFTAATVTYERKFNGAQKATLCLPYDLYAQGFKAYTLSGGNKNEVHFKEVDDKLTAYTPYYITANGMRHRCRCQRLHSAGRRQVPQGNDGQFRRHHSCLPCLHHLSTAGVRCQAALCRPRRRDHGHRQHDERGDRRKERSGV